MGSCRAAAAAPTTAGWPASVSITTAAARHPAAVSSFFFRQITLIALNRFISESLRFPFQNGRFYAPGQI